MRCAYNISGGNVCEVSFISAARFVWVIYWKLTVSNWSIVIELLIAIGFLERNLLMYQYMMLSWICSQITGRDYGLCTMHYKGERIFFCKGTRLYLNVLFQIFFYNRLNLCNFFTSNNVNINFDYFICRNRLNVFGSRMWPNYVSSLPPKLWYSFTLFFLPTAY